MAIPLQRIGIYTFTTLQGNLQPPAPVKIPDDRQGVDGTEFVLAGTKGQPFVLISTVDDEDIQAARHTLKSYLDTIAEGAVEVIKDDVSTLEEGYKCSVLSVREIDCRAITGACGNKLSNSAGAYLAAEWTLVAVPEA